MIAATTVVPSVLLLYFYSATLIVLSTLAMPVVVHIFGTCDFAYTRVFKYLGDVYGRHNQSIWENWLVHRLTGGVGIGFLLNFLSGKAETPRDRDDYANYRARPRTACHHTSAKNIIVFLLLIFCASFFPLNDDKRLEYIIDPRNTDFTGRGALFEEIEKRLTGGQGKSTSQVILAGMSGVGKTQIASEYAYRNREKYNVIWSLQANSMDDGLYQLAQGLDIVDINQVTSEFDVKKIASSIRKSLQKRSDWLLVIDNAQEQSDIRECIKRYFPRTGGHIIVTTLNSNWPEALIVEQLVDAESMTLLKKSSGKKEGPLSQTEQRAARTIVTRLGGLPLALSQAGAWIKQDRSMTFAKYLDYFDGPRVRRELWKNDPVAATLRLNLKQIKSGDSHSILELASFVASKEIPAKLFTELLKGLATTLAASPEELEVKVKNAARKLMEYSILKRGNDDTYAIHQLHQTVIRDVIEDEKRSQEVSDRAARVLKKTLNGTKPYSAERNRLLAHVLEAAPRLEQISGQNEELWGLLLGSADKLLDAGHYSKAKRVLDLATKCGDRVKESTRGKEIEEIQLLDALNYHCRGRLAKKNGHYDQALEMYSKCLEIRLSVLGANHTDVATTYNKMGNVYSSKWQFDKALRKYEESLQIRLPALGDDDPDVARTYTGMGGVYQSMGQYDKALEVNQKSLRIWKKRCGENHPLVAITYRCIGKVYKEKGRYSDALMMYEKSRDIELDVLGEDHPDLATTYRNMGSVYKSLGQYTKALEVYQKSANIGIAAYGEDHPGLALTYASIAAVYRWQGRFDKASEMNEKSLKIWRAMKAGRASLGEDHLELTITYAKTASVYFAQGQYDKALEKYKKCLKIRIDTLGKDHAHVANMYSDTGEVYYAQGQYDKALEMYDKSIKINLAAFGEEHPHVTKTYGKIGNVYYSLGRYDDALEMFNKCLKIEPGVRGEDHPHVATLYKGLGNVYSRQKQYEKAFEMYNECLKIRRFKFGDDNLRVADAYAHIGNLYRRRKQYDSALQMLEKSLKISRAALGQNHPNVATTYKGFGKVYFAQGQFNEALEKYKKCLDIRLDALGEDHPDVGDAYFLIGQVLSKQGRHDEALKRMEKGLDIMSTRLGQSHSRVEEMRHTIGALKVQ